ncbi:HAD family phosphatase [Nitratireductor sp. L1-7-SE]|uniref:HAD family phosphatase n=1 Tax=Nitratireductor rhodophyticola TaxID=2854036 RepID=A0ABS7RF58_9HYPH|nr:HAD family phosphatase [Nitratireductor rhodophyticola]MBY8918155.1 HAD family phosphatase [Nitratireductor rhodophyticola]MBY8921036.1 HAD family phosphatase [Nitratireductor rhodophyticola]
MSEIRHIVFDIGRVLIHYDPEIPYRRLIPDDAQRRWFLENVCTGDWNIEQDRGRGWEDAEALLIAEHPQEEENIRGFRRHWHEMVPYAYDDSVAMLETLIDAGHDVTMLTNFAADTFAEARERYTFLNRPRGVTVSGEVGLLKPDRAIYDIHVESFGLEPAATLFIDDSEKNVEGARDAGWQAVHFSGAEKLRSDLAGYGFAV